jgi:hypothetical protein
VDGEQLALDQVRLGRRAQTDRHIGLAHRDVELGIVEDELQADAGMKIKELV